MTVRATVRRAVDNRPYAPAGSDPGIRHSPAGADLTQPAG